MKKKLLALICALALVFSLVAAPFPPRTPWAASVILRSLRHVSAGTVQCLPAGRPACRHRSGHHRRKSFLKETITTDSDSGETAVVSDYVAQQTQQTLETLAAVDARFKALGGELTAEQLSTADRYAQQMMDQYGDTYTANGIGLETVKAYERLQVEHTALLDMVYGPDGETRWRTTS